MTSILNENKELFDKITSYCGNVYRRRLIKDLEDLITVYSIVKVNFDENLRVPIVTVIADCNVIKITLHKSFPFKCHSSIELNGEPYSKILIYTSGERKAALKELKGIDCLCCESYLCESNWKIQLRLRDIVDEVLKNIQINKELDTYIRNKHINNNNNSNDNSNINTNEIVDSNKKRKIH